jgi:hypothetical protein
MDFVWILVMIAKMEQIRELNHKASATQIALLVRDQGSVEKTAPPQKVAYSISSVSSHAI